MTKELSRQEKQGSNVSTGLAQRASGEWEVETENGTVIAEQRVNAGGSFARRQGEMMGIKLPIVDMIHHYLVTETIPEVEAQDFELPLVEVGLLGQNQKIRGLSTSVHDPENALLKR